MVNIQANDKKLGMADQAIETSLPLRFIDDTEEPSDLVTMVDAIPKGNDSPLDEYENEFERVMQEQEKQEMCHRYTENETRSRCNSRDNRSESVTSSEDERSIQDKFNETSEDIQTGTGMQALNNDELSCNKTGVLDATSRDESRSQLHIASQNIHARELTNGESSPTNSELDAKCEDKPSIHIQSVHPKLNPIAQNTIKTCKQGLSYDESICNTSSGLVATTTTNKSNSHTINCAPDKCDLTSPNYTPTTTRRLSNTESSHSRSSGLVAKTTMGMSNSHTINCAPDKCNQTSQNNTPTPPRRFGNIESSCSHTIGAIEICNQTSQNNTPTPPRRFGNPEPPHNTSCALTVKRRAKLSFQNDEYAPNKLNQTPVPCSKSHKVYYPPELNPFAEDETEKGQSTNPFGDSDDEESVLVPPKPQPRHSFSTARVQDTREQDIEVPVKPRPRHSFSTPRVQDTRVQDTRLPVPMPRSISKSMPTTPNQSPLLQPSRSFRLPSPGASAYSSIRRKKKPAPAPPAPSGVPFPSLVISPATLLSPTAPSGVPIPPPVVLPPPTLTPLLSPPAPSGVSIHSPGASPKTKSRLRKTRLAPPPPKPDNAGKQSTVSPLSAK